MEPPDNMMDFPANIVISIARWHLLQREGNAIKK